MYNVNLVAAVKFIFPIVFSAEEDIKSPMIPLLFTSASSPSIVPNLIASDADVYAATPPSAGIVTPSANIYAF